LLVKQPDDAARGVKLAGFLVGGVGELFDEILVGLPQHVGLGSHVGQG